MRLERTVSWSQTRRDTNFAIPGYSISAIIPRRREKSKIFLSVVIYVVKAAFIPLSAIGGNPANTGVTRLCGVSPCLVSDTATALPNQARYQLRYTRIFNFCHDTTASGKNKDFPVCGHLCGQSRFYAAFGNRGKSRKRRCHKALRRFALPRSGYRHGTPKPGAIPTSLYPDIQFLPLYHGGGENQRFFCLWSFLWSKPLLRRFQQSGKFCKCRRRKALRRFTLPRPGYRHGTPKSRALPTALHPDIHFSAIIPRQAVKIKIFLSVVIYVVKAAFVPPSATGGNPANAGAARLCGVSPCPVPDTATALPKQARYQLRYTRLYIAGLSDRPHSIPYSAPVFKSFLHRRPTNL